MELTKNTILITGGTSGIGFEMAKRFLALGNTVIVTGRNSDKIQKTLKALPGVNAIQSDVSNTKAVEDLFKKVVQEYPNLNILINNAGIMRTINLHDTTGSLDDLTLEIETNLNGPIRMTRQFLGHLKNQKNAAIVNVSSGLAFVPLPISPVYCSTKAALHSFTLSLRVQLKNTSVKVFELAPPATATELLGDFHGDDMKGISIMKVEDMVNAAINGMKSNQLEIRPGQSNQLKMMSRIAPQFILNQMSKPVDRMLAAKTLNS